MVRHLKIDLAFFQALKAPSESTIHMLVEVLPVVPLEIIGKIIRLMRPRQIKMRAPYLALPLQSELRADTLIKTVMARDSLNR